MHDLLVCDAHLHGLLNTLNTLLWKDNVYQAHESNRKCRSMLFICLRKKRKKNVLH